MAILATIFSEWTWIPGLQAQALDFLTIQESSSTFTRQKAETSCTAQSSVPQSSSALNSSGSPRPPLFSLTIQQDWVTSIISESNSGGTRLFHYNRDHLPITLTLWITVKWKLLFLTSETKWWNNVSWLQGQAAVMACSIQVSALRRVMTATT